MRSRSYAPGRGSDAHFAAVGMGYAGSAQLPNGQGPGTFNYNVGGPGGPNQRQEPTNSAYDQCFSANAVSNAHGGPRMPPGSGPRW
jgi:hypothetical protein